MSITGNENGLVINGGKLRVAGGIVVNGSIAYSENATGFGGVTAQIDNDNTLNITAGKVSGVAEIDRGTGADITSVNHTNVVNNTTIHIALKNTAGPGIFIYLNRFDGVRTNYTDDYVIAPGETGMLTLRKVNGVLSLFVREMYSTNYTVTSTNPFFIKDGLNYKYPLYTSITTDVVLETINGTSYYRPTTGLRTKSRPPKGLPEFVLGVTGNLAIGNNLNLTDINYDVWDVPTNYELGNIYRGSTKKASFLIENGGASGTFTDSDLIPGDSYTLYVNTLETSVSDIVDIITQTNTYQYLSFHYSTFDNGNSEYSDIDIYAAAVEGRVYYDTPTGEYSWGTLNSTLNTPEKTTYVWTPPGGSLSVLDVLMVAGGGGGGKQVGGGGGAGGLLHYTDQIISGQQTIEVGAGGIGGVSITNTTAYPGNNTTFSGFDTAIGGGSGATYNNIAGSIGGSGGGGGGAPTAGYAGTVGQGNAGGNGRVTNWGGGGGGGAGTVGLNSPSNNIGGPGGLGLDKSSVFGTIYGERGWFAGGGGGCANNTTQVGGGGRGGGGQGGNNATDITGNRGDGMKHTGGGGGGTRDGNLANNNLQNGGDGGSGIVLMKWIGDKDIGKFSNKILAILVGGNTITFTIQGADIASIKYSVNGGSEQVTSIDTLTVPHGLNIGTIGTFTAYPIDSSGLQLGSTLTVSDTVLYDYEILTLTTHINATETLTIIDNDTDNITSVYKSSGVNGWNTGFYTPEYIAPVTLEFNKTASTVDNGASYFRIGISDNPTVAATTGTLISNLDYYVSPYYTTAYVISSATGNAVTNGSAWDISLKHYIVYKEDGTLQFWNGPNKKFEVSWGTGKSIRFEADCHVNNTNLTNRLTNVRVKRREWNGTEYIN